MPVRFADVEFDVKAGELRRAGVTSRLEPQPARVLALLVERAGDVVTRPELQQHVWSGDTFVDFERGLNYCIAQIRTALGDSASSPRFIEMLPRRGYRFIAPVETVQPVQAVQASVSDTDQASTPDADEGARGFGGEWPVFPRSRPPRSPAARIAVIVGGWTLVIAGVLLAWAIVARLPRTDAVANRPQRIAVALFDNETKHPDYDQVAQTLTDAIVARLASDPSRLTVVGNSPILRQVRSFRDIPAIGAKLETPHVIVGQVQEIGGRLRVTAHLIRAADEGHVWARRFEPSESDMPTLDRKVADAVAAAVAEKLLAAR